MKILCPIDFSRASLNAVRYMLDYTVNRNDIEIEFLNCLENVAGMNSPKTKINLEKEKAQIFFELYVEQIKRLYPHVRYSYTIVFGYSDTFIAAKAEEIEADLIVIGSKGLSHIKDLTTGSVTENVVKHSNVPVLCVPLGYKFSIMNNLALAVDDKQVNHPLIFNFLNDFLEGYRPKLSVIQVKPVLSKEEIQYDQRIDDYIDKWEVEVTSLDYNKSIPNTINEYISSQAIDITCYVHRKRNWLSKMFQYTNLKEELYELEYPMLIFSD